MPLGPQRENPKGLAASYRDRALDLAVHKFADTCLHLLSRILLHSVQVAFLFGLLVPSNIFQITHGFCDPSIKVSRVFHK